MILIDFYQILFIYMFTRASSYCRKLSSSPYQRKFSMSQAAAAGQTTSKVNDFTNGNLAVFVKGKLKEDSRNAFYAATLKNARYSILEDGIARFDLLRNIDRPDDFLLIEVYKSAADPDKHKLTQHYKDWRVAVEPFMSVPRSASKYTTLYPPKQFWDAAEQSSNDDVTGYLQHRPWDAEACSVRKISLSSPNTFSFASCRY